MRVANCHFSNGHQRTDPAQVHGAYAFTHCRFMNLTNTRTIQAAEAFPNARVVAVDQNPLPPRYALSILRGLILV